MAPMLVPPTKSTGRSASAEGFENAEMREAPRAPAAQDEVRGRLPVVRRTSRARSPCGRREPEAASPPAGPRRRDEGAAGAGTPASCRTARSFRIQADRTASRCRPRAGASAARRAPRAAGYDRHGADRGCTRGSRSPDPPPGSSGRAGSRKRGTTPVGAVRPVRQAAGPSRQTGVEGRGQPAAESRSVEPSVTASTAKLRGAWLRRGSPWRGAGERPEGGRSTARSRDDRRPPLRRRRGPGAADACRAGPWPWRIAAPRSEAPSPRTCRRRQAGETTGLPVQRIACRDADGRRRPGCRARLPPHPARRPGRRRPQRRRRTVAGRPPRGRIESREEGDLRLAHRDAFEACFRFRAARA